MPNLTPPNGTIKRQARVILGLSLSALAVIISWLVYLDYHNTERELLKLMKDNAMMLAETQAALISQHQRSYLNLHRELSRRLVSNAKTLSFIEESRLLTPAYLEEFAKLNGLHRIHLIDSAGNREISVPSSMEFKHAEPRNQVLEPLLNGRVKELIIGLSDSRFGDQTRFIVAVRRPKGGAIVVNVEATLLEDYRREMGLGRSLRNLTNHSSVVYAILQDEEGLISVSPPEKEVSLIAEDENLRELYRTNESNSRFIPHNGMTVLEVVKPILLDEEYRAVFRIGLSLEFYNENLKELTRRDIALALVFFAGGGLLFGLLYQWQHNRFHKSRYLQSLQMAEHITENMQEALIVLDENRVATRVNNIARKFFGIDSGQELSPDLICHLESNSLLADGHRSQHLKWNSQILLAHSQNLPEQGSSGTASKLLLFLDVTREKESETKLLREEKLAALGRLVAAVAHEIRNPLNSISLSVQNSIRGLRKENRENARFAMETILEEIKRLDRLVEDFLVFSRPVSRPDELIHIADIVNRTNDIFTAEMNDLGVKFQFNQSPGPFPDIWGNEERLIQVITNLLRNALEAMPRGGRIIADLRRVDNSTQLTFQDTGPGFSQDSLDLALEPFYTTKAKGTGLGLSMSRDIIRHFGWDLEISNHPEGGGLVTIIIPENQEND